MSDHPFLKRMAQKGTTGHGRISEKRVAKSLAAMLTPNSGALASAKGDMKRGKKKPYVVEAKSTVHTTLSIDLGWLVKIAVEALSLGKTPALTISFVTPEGKAKPRGEWVLIPLYDFRELIDAMEQE